MNEEVLNVAELLGAIRRHLLAIVFFMGTSVAAGIVALSVLPKTYKADAIIGIQTGYFRNPLIDDFISQASDPSEVKAQRSSLIRQALDERFLDSLGERYNVYETSPSSPQRPIEREMLLKRIEYFSDSPTTMFIAISAKNADSAFLMLKEIVDRVLNTLATARQQALIRTRDAIQEQATFLAKALKSSSVPAEIELLQTELAKMEAALDAMRLRYTENHPEVVRLRQEVEGIRRKVARSTQRPEVTVAPANEAIAEPVTEALGQKSSRQSLENLYNDLVRKLSYLTITLAMDGSGEVGDQQFLSIVKEPSMPLAPVRPRRQIVLGISVVAGLLLSVGYVFIRELKRGSFLSPFRTAEALQTRLLGELLPMENAADFRAAVEAARRSSRRPGLLLPFASRRDES